MKEEKNIQIKIALLDQENKPFMGIGIVWLMRAVQQHKSLKKSRREYAPFVFQSQQNGQARGVGDRSAVFAKPQRRNRTRR